MLDLNGGTVTLPAGVFTTPFLTGADNVTNNPVSPATGTLIEGGGLPGTTYSGIISDGTSSTAWTHTGGEVTITGANIYTGATTIEGGPVIGGAANAFSAASATTVNAGGTLDLGGFNQTVSSLAGAGVVTNGGSTGTLTNQGASSIFSGVIQDGAGATGLIQNSPGNTLILTGANTFTGGTTIAAGTLQIGNGGTTGSGVGNVTDNGTLAFDRSDSKTVTALISGTGSVAQIGTGVTTLAAANTYSGGTTISAGSLGVTGSGTLGAISNAVSVSGGILDMGGTPQTQNGGVALTSGTIQNGTLSSSGTFGLQSGMVSATLAGSGGLSKTTAGTVIFTGDNTYTGGTTIAAGTLQLGNGGTSGSFLGINVIDNGTLAFDRSDNATTTGLISGTGAVTQIGTGTTTLAVAQTYTGGTTVTAGTLGVTGPGTFGASSGAVTVSGGILELGGTSQTQDGGVTLTSGTIQNGTLSSSGTFGVQAGTVSASLAGAAGLSKTTAGTVTLSAVNTYTGGTIVSAGTLDVLGSGTLGATTNSLTVSGGVLDLGGTTQTQNNVTVSGGTIQDGTLLAGGTFNLQSGTVSTSLGGSAGINKTTPGTLTLSTANNLLTGATTISAGTLRAAHVSSLGVIDVFGNGRITLGGGTAGATLTLASLKSGTLTNQLDIDTTGSGSSSTIAATTGRLIIDSALAYFGGAGTLHFGTATDASTVALNPASISVSGNGQISVDAGTLVLLNSNAQTLLGGVSDVNVVGRLDLNSLPDPTIVKSLTLADGTIANGNLNGPISSSGGTLSGIGGTASLTTTAGTTMLLGNNSYGGMTTVSGGALEVAGALGLSGVPSGPITLASGGTLNVDLSGSINIGGSSFTNGGTLNNSGAITAGGLTNFAGGTINNLAGATINGGLTNNSSGTVNAAGTINGGIQNFGTSNFNNTSGGFNLVGNLNSDGMFNNSGTVRIDQSQTNVTLGGKGFTFINNGVLDLRNPHTVATNLTIQGNYAAQDPLILLNVFGGQANHLTVTGSASGATNVEVLAFNNNPLPIFTNAIPIINVDGASSSATFTAIQSPSPTSLGNLVTYGVVEESPGQWDLVSHINPAPVGAIAGGISSAVTSVATGFFQGTTAFLGAPATTTPNQIDGGVWNRDAAGFNNERSVSTTSQSGATDLKTQTRFMGYQVGSDLGMFNIQNTGWNLHGGITGGEYVASSGELNFGGSSSNYTVPFLGLYAAATGHGFFADVLLRHDFWQGNVSDSTAGLTGARMNGNGNAVTAEAGYTYHFQNGVFNGVFVTPSLGFAYTNANFQQLALLPGSTVQPTLNVGAIVSDLGRLGATLGDTFATPFWALTPNVNVSVWHEFAGAIPSVFNYAPSNFTDTVSQTRVGTFGQFGIGLIAQPIQNPNWTLFARADWRTGSNIYGGTLTGGFRYQF